MKVGRLSIFGWRLEDQTRCLKDLSTRRGVLGRFGSASCRIWRKWEGQDGGWDQKFPSVDELSEAIVS